MMTSEKVKKEAGRVQFFGGGGRAIETAISQGGRGGPYRYLGDQPAAHAPLDVITATTVRKCGIGPKSKLFSMENGHKKVWLELSSLKTDKKRTKETEVGAIDFAGPPNSYGLGRRLKQEIKVSFEEGGRGRLRLSLTQSSIGRKEKKEALAGNPLLLSSIWGGGGHPPPPFFSPLSPLRAEEHRAIPERRAKDCNQELLGKGRVFPPPSTSSPPASSLARFALPQMEKRRAGQKTKAKMTNRTEALLSIPTYREGRRFFPSGEKEREGEKSYSFY